MKLTELQAAVRAADPAAVLVAPWLLARVIQQEHRLGRWFSDTPHRESYVVDRQALLRHVEQDELDLEPDYLLPETVILLARPTPEALAGQDRDDILLAYWRRLFHAGVHLALQRRREAGALGPADVQARVEVIGRTELEEVRAVLEQDEYLLPPRDDWTVYVEFAAVYLELRSFAPGLVPVYFPGILNAERIDALLAQDVDAAALLARTRLPGAPDPAVQAAQRADESHDYYWKLVRQAQRADAKGDTVRAAILRTRAARVAPAARAAGTRLEALAGLKRLTDRLQAALELSDADAAEWLKDLPAMLDKADQGRWPVEAALLYDLQKVGVDHEREIYTLDLMEWLLSAGRRPIKRPLPGQRLVRTTKHLRSAAQRLTMARLSDEERAHLGRLVENALHDSKERLRARFRPVLTDALRNVGLQPANPPERTAFAKMVEEMLDRIAELGFLTFSDLRDTISRNQLKLPDVTDPQDFVRSDPLLRLDRRLGSALDGVYRPGEFYLRWLERVTVPSFGTKTGRLITRYFTLPFGGALLLLEGLQVMLDHFGLRLPTFAPLSALLPAEGDTARMPVVGLIAFLATSFFLMGLMHVEAMRRACKRAGLLAYRALHGLFVELPAWVLRNPLLRRVWRSWAFQLFSSYLLKPLVAWAVVGWWQPAVFHRWDYAVVTFAVANVVLNSRFGRAVGAVVVQTLEDFYDLLRAGLLPGLFRLVMALFKQVITTIEYVLFSVDDWLRFRGGDTRASMVARTILGFLWFPVSYLARFYAIVLIEPGFNPIKAPVSYLAAKVMVPVIKPLTEGVVTTFEPVLGRVLAWVVAVPTVWLLPDAFGFLFWEIKENWSLYRANRRPYLRPVSVGPHGETVRQLLQPGFHSGTVPKLFARLRYAERQALQTGNWRAARAGWHTLQEVERTVQRLVDREFVALLRQSPAWQGEELRAGPIALASNRIRIELAHARFLAEPVWLELAERAGWLVADVQAPGWLRRLTADQRQTLATALAGLYKLAAVDLVREQVCANLPPPAAGYDLTAGDLVLEDKRHAGALVYYDLRDPQGELRPRHPDGSPARDWPVLPAGQLVFAQVPIPWGDWVRFWEADQERPAARVGMDGDGLLLPAARAAAPWEALPAADGVPALPAPDGKDGNGRGEGMPAPGFAGEAPGVNG